MSISYVMFSGFTGNLSMLSNVIGVVFYLLITGLIASLYAIGFVYVRERASCGPSESCFPLCIWA